MTETHQAHLCDFCSDATAVLYCRADSAKLCLACDLAVHSTNHLFRKHTRSLLCNACASSPSSIFCRTESAVLCQNCDWEAHRGPGSSVHDRSPVEGFNGCPSVGEMLGVLGLDDLGKKEVVGDEEGDGFWDMIVWETPVIVSVDDLVEEKCGLNKAMGVPPLPKNRNAVCGKHKDEILCQLREMAKKDPNFSGSLEDFEPYIGVQSEEPGKCPLTYNNSPRLESKVEPITVPSYETSALKWSPYTGEGFTSTFMSSFVEMNRLVPDNDSDAGDNTISFANGFEEVHSCRPSDSKNFQVIPIAGPRELNSQEREERDSAISRYKEKKKTRRYEKHIRYESRKARAESRTRIKGRFAKMDR